MPRRPRPAPGMTLVELLVAFVILLMLVGALVTLTTRSLETWSTGEARKDVYDRARVVLDSISDDLRSTYSEGEFQFLDMQPLQPPAFAADVDLQRRPRLRFVRSGDAGRLRAQVEQPQRIAPAMWYTPLWEVAYVAHPERPTELWRGIRSFDRRKTETLLNPMDYTRETDALFRSRFRKVESGILYAGYRFWTQYTTTWDDAAPVTKLRPGSREKSGPEDRWDSTRRTDPEFFFHRAQNDLQTPDFVYPEIVQVTVTVESMPPEMHGVRLIEGADERSAYLRLSHTRGLPEAPGLVKLGHEWIEYGQKTSSDLMSLRRGARGTKPQAHLAGAAVLFGESFTTEVRIGAYRESQSP